MSNNIINHWRATFMEQKRIEAKQLEEYWNTEAGKGLLSELKRKSKCDIDINTIPF